jgi:hypothetical protein
MVTLLVCRFIMSSLVFVAAGGLAAAADQGTWADGATVLQQAAGNPADAIVGDWRPADMNVDVRIFASGGEYLGGIVKADNPAMVNKEMLRGITFDPTTSTWKGEVFAMKRGDFVPMTIRMTPAGFEMVAGSGFMSKTINWVRVQ